MKLYTNDENIHYKGTKLSAERSKADIDGTLARWGIKKTAWEWDPENNRVVLQFQFSERFKDRNLEPIVRLEPPRLWRKRKREQDEVIDWRLSMRVFYWNIKTTLEMAYAMQSEKTIAFLPYIVTGGTEENPTTVKDDIVPELERLKKFKALEEKIPP